MKNFRHTRPPHAFRAAEPCARPTGLTTTRKLEAQMAYRAYRFVLAAGITAASLFPVSAYAGTGGSPASPGAAAGAGRGTAYCCSTWTPRQISAGKDVFGREQTITVFDGASCFSIDDKATERNDCSAVSGTTTTCRGEFFKPSGLAGSVTRCFAP